MTNSFFYSADISGTKIHVQGILDIDCTSVQQAFEYTLRYIANYVGHDISRVSMLAFNKV